MPEFDFNDAYIFVDEKRNLLVMRKLGDLPQNIDVSSLSFAERQELRPVENVITEEQLVLTEEGKRLLLELKRVVIIKDAGSEFGVPGRYYLHPSRLEALKKLIAAYAVK